MSMVSFFHNLTNNLINYMQIFGPWFGFLIVFLESIFPWLPLCVFIALNIASYGNIWGFLISLIATILGCVCSYTFFKYLFGNKLAKLIKKANYKKIKRVVDSIEKIDFSNLVLLISLPFAPAFLINIACGIAKVNFKKFFLALLIGKIVIVYFWGFIGTSLLESITDATTVILVCLLLIGAFIISKIVVKKFNIE